MRHAIDQWNGRHSPVFGFYLSLISPIDASASVDIRFCDIAQRHLVAIFLSSDSVVGVELSDFRIALSMCKRFRIPCLLDGLPSSNEKNPFLTNVGPTSQMFGQALAQLIVRMMWSSFVFLYKDSNELSHLLPLFALRRSLSGTRVSFRAIQMPSAVERYGPFLKHIRERLRHTNILLYTDDLGIVHSLLVHASKMNMSQTRYSYLVSNMDLHLLEDFLGPEFHCNITGFQLVRQQPQIKTDLALAMDATALVGAAVHALRQRNLEPKPYQLLCDAGDQWTDGMLMQEQIRRVDLTDAAATGGYSAASAIRFNETTGERMDTSLLAITRMPNGTFTDLGKWEEVTRRWTFDGRHDERNKWRFRVGQNGAPDLRGERLKVVVYLEEPFVMRKLVHPSMSSPFSPYSVSSTSSSSSSSSSSSFVDRILAQPIAKVRQGNRHLNRGWHNNEKDKVGQNELGSDAEADEEFEGFCIDLLKEMAKLLNFTYDIEVIDDGTYGVEDENGRWNGIIGVLQRHEADLSVSAVTITYSRVSVIDFTLPFMHLGIAILMRRNMADEAAERSGGSNLFTFMEPLSFSVWVALAVAYASVAGTMWLLAKCSPYEWYEDVTRRDTIRRRRDGTRGDTQPPKDWRGTTAEKGRGKARAGPILHKNQFSILNSLWFAVGSLMQQGSDVIPRAAATRTVAVIWWLFTLILISSYTAQLAAFLTVERMSTAVESSADLAAQQRIKFGTLSNGSTMEFFRESRIPIYERMWSIMQSTTPTVFVNSSREGIARVKGGNYAYMMESTMLEYWIGEDCQLQTIGGLLDSKGYGIALPKGSPLRGIFSRAVLQLQERTIVEALKNKWWKGHRPRTASADASSPFAASSAGVCPPPNGLSHSSLYRLLAISEFCIESRRRQSLRLGLSLPGRIIGWALAWRGESEENTVQHHTLAKSSKLSASQLYLDTVGPIVDGSGMGRGQMWPFYVGIHSNATKRVSFSSADYDIISCSMANEGIGHGHPSQPVPAHSSAVVPCTAPSPQSAASPPVSVFGDGQSSSSIDEMDDFIATLRSVHSPQQQQQKDEQQQIHLPNCSKLSVGVEPKRRAPPVRQRHVSMPKDEEDRQRHGDTLAVPSSPNPRKVSEPNAPVGPRRKNSIRGMFAKLSTPSIVIGADPQDFHALHHLIPLTDERLLKRRHSSNQPEMDEEEDDDNSAAKC
ncbi:hypothetical protein niasHS_005639 [Heterodera schachtii]|uniref:Uncharacterized protein n=1 Tax=Heterodera schachtii TaxID=97005 RepID=A0ABD2JZ19_HETSC